jgi:hypothetical protein
MSSYTRAQLPQTHRRRWTAMEDADVEKDLADNFDEEWNNK